MSANHVFWGHVDIRFSGTNFSVGGPISSESAGTLGQRLAEGCGSARAWASIKTLSNRLVTVRLDQVQSVFFIDDGSEWPSGERSWETTLDDYAGISLDQYRAMAMWADSDQSEWAVSGAIRTQARELVEHGGFLHRANDLRVLLRHTVVHFTDGTSASYHVSRQHLVELVETIEDGDTVFVSLPQYDDDFERYINLSSVRAIDISLIELLAAYDDE